jgi:hypothetical protein
MQWLQLDKNSFFPGAHRHSLNRKQDNKAMGSINAMFAKTQAPQAFIIHFAPHNNYSIR